MTKLVTCTFLPVLVVLGVASTAWADVAPPPDYVEECTVDQQEGANETCISCNTYHGEPDACSDEWAPQGYEHRCNTAGASVWDEVWCKADETEGTGDTPANGDEEETTDEVEETTEGCGDEGEDGLARASIVANSAGAAVCAFLAVGALIFIRRRR